MCQKRSNDLPQFLSVFEYYIVLFSICFLISLSKNIVFLTKDMDMPHRSAGRCATDELAISAMANVICAAIDSEPSES